MYLDIIESPLVNFKLEDIDKYSWPEPFNEKLFTYTKNECKNLKENTDYAIVSKTIGSIFEPCRKMRLFIFCQRYIINGIMGELLKVNFNERTVYRRV